MTLARLFSTCCFRHSSEWTRGRNATGQVTRLCARCQADMGVLLGSEMIVAHAAPQAIPGQPQAKAKRVVKDNVTPWKVSSR